MHTYIKKGNYKTLWKCIKENVKKWRKTMFMDRKVMYCKHSYHVQVNVYI